MRVHNHHSSHFDPRIHFPVHSLVHNLNLAARLRHPAFIRIVYSSISQFESAIPGLVAGTRAEEGFDARRVYSDDCNECLADRPYACRVDGADVLDGGDAADDGCGDDEEARAEEEGD
jgi:hypothetical protein